MKKRIISAALAAIMTVSALSTAAFADELANDGALTASGITALPTLKVTMPKSISFIVNPYNLTVDAKGKAVASDATGALTGTFVPVYGTGNESWDIVNNSGIALTAKMYAIATAGNESILLNPAESAWDAAAKKAKKKIAFTLKAGTKKAKDDGTLEADVAAAAVTLVSEAPASWAADSVKSLTVKDKGALSLTITDASATVDSTYEGTGWTAEDTVNLSMAFKFDFVVNS